MINGCSVLLLFCTFVELLWMYVLLYFFSFFFLLFCFIFLWVFCCCCFNYSHWPWIRPEEQAFSNQGQWEISSSNKLYKAFSVYHSTGQSRNCFIDQTFLRGPWSICNVCPRGAVDETSAALLIRTRISN